MLENEADAAVAMTRVNNLLEAHNPGTMFVSLLIVLYDPQTGDLTYLKLPRLTTGDSLPERENGFLQNLSASSCHHLGSLYFLWA